MYSGDTGLLVLRIASQIEVGICDIFSLELPKGGFGSNLYTPKQCTRIAFHTTYYAYLIIN